MARRHVAAAPAGPAADQRPAAPQASRAAVGGEATPPVAGPATGEPAPGPEVLREAAGAEPTDPPAAQVEVVEAPGGEPVELAEAEAGLDGPVEAELAERLLDRVEQMARQMPSPRASAFDVDPAARRQVPPGLGLSPRVRLLLQLLAVAALSALALGLHLLTR